MTQAQSEALTIVCYDIADDRRRRQVVGILQGYGIRVQESVFECWLMPAQGAAMKACLAEAIHHGEDRVALYLLSAEEIAGIVILGSGEGLSDNPDAYIM